MNEPKDVSLNIAEGILEAVEHPLLSRDVGSPGSLMRRANDLGQELAQLRARTTPANPTAKGGMKPQPTREELRALFESYDYTLPLSPESVSKAARAGWECGYAARQAREKETFASGHGTRTVAVLKALLAISRPSDARERAVVDAAGVLLDELEKGMVTGSSTPIAEARGANGPGGQYKIVKNENGTILECRECSMLGGDHALGCPFIRRLAASQEKS
jgi:hypothetical protein